MIHYEFNGNLGQRNVTIAGNEYVFGYPCGDSPGNCAPYEIYIKPGKYLFEAWGSAGIHQGTSKSGLGGYSSGILKIKNKLKVYALIGSTSIFNIIKDPYTAITEYPGGAATDIRLSYDEKTSWYDPVSLRSRIFIAGGGGSSEWIGSIGGNGGGLNGTRGYSDCNYDGKVCPSIITTGGTQLSGGFASKYQMFGDEPGYGINGTFGISIRLKTEMGGIGGSGYYSGASLTRAGAGGGGSSFISGYPGCIALKSSDSDEPSDSNVHFSKFKFSSAKMIVGNNTMPLYSSKNSEGIGNKHRGALRITILSNLYDETQDYHSCLFIDCAVLMVAIYCSD